MTDSIRANLDLEYSVIASEIQELSINRDKHFQLRIKNWLSKLGEYQTRLEFRKNRNLYAIALLDCVLRNKFEGPFIKMSKENGSLPILSKTEVFSKLSGEFTQLMKNKLEDRMKIEGAPIDPVMKSAKNKVKLKKVIDIASRSSAKSCLTREYPSELTRLQYEVNYLVGELKVKK